ncbi:L,D-transpeptidase [Mycolicibacterium sediminis]|uniref:Putative L,D-transpeptidase 3 n=1 Tax=Mycolicibacterium sediminis TaxID=1286180 RepID=A0A7I7QMQ5_9MYCO|nr:L,D-transpeptidase [Mycolicibacterium sediminis]BBY27669.1 putative L,D-transpeptidase 3 [Mycolicibacterium sediminis]
MRTILRSLLVVVLTAVGVVAGPVAVGSGAAASRIGEYAIASVAPAPDQVVGVAHPVVVTFTGPVADRSAAERALGIRTTPAMTGTFEWQGADTVQWVPDQFWPAHTTVALSVGNRVTTLRTGPAVIGTANISEHTFTVTIDGVEAGPPLPAPHHRPRFGEEGVFPASMGRPKYPTPVGKYTVLGKERDVKMDSSSVGIPVDSPDGYMLDVEYAVRFTSRGLFVHSAPWAVNSLGYENVSHGCVGLSTEDAEWYFNTVNVGDPIIIQENAVEVPRPVAPPVNPEVPRRVS